MTAVAVVVAIDFETLVGVCALARQIAERNDADPVGGLHRPDAALLAVGRIIVALCHAASQVAL